MKTGLLVLLVSLFFCMPMNAQLKTRTQEEPRPADDLPRRPLLYGGEPIAKNMVWRADTQKREWVQVEVNSCEWCGRPMTWKQAAFDKKALPLWIAATALAVADTEYTMSRPCIRARTCEEWNPLLGKTRAQQYGVRMPALAMAWFGTAWVRKGHSQDHIGGMRHWYLFPASFIAMPTAGLAANSVRR
jgi:hypothetical protein